MPSSGNPLSYTRGSQSSASSPNVDSGPPLSTTAAGSRFAISSHDASNGSSSEYTFASRARRAISWLT